MSSIFQEKHTALTSPSAKVPSLDALLGKAERLEHRRGLGNLNVAALISACCQAMFVREFPTISYLGGGSFNIAFLVAFPNGAEVVARIPFQDTYSPGSVSSQVATMAYVSFRKGIPVPGVYAWRDDEDNPVGVPYLIMQRVSGVPLYNLWDKLPMEQKSGIVAILCRHHAAMALDIPFKKYSSLFFAANANDGEPLDLSCDAAYEIRDFVRQKCPLITAVQPDWVPKATTDMLHTWKEGLRVEHLAMCKRWGVVDEDSFITEDDADIREIAECEDATWGELVHAHKVIAKLLESEVTPIPFRPCIVHPDYALRNVIVNSDTIAIIAASILSLVFLLQLT